VLEDEIPWGGVSRLARRPLIGLLYQPRMADDECGAVSGMRAGRGNRSTWSKLAPVPLCSPQIPHYLTWARTPAVAAGSRRDSRSSCCGQQNVSENVCRRRGYLSRSTVCVTLVLMSAKKPQKVVSPVRV
jgi:hypothetical protein